MTEKVNVLIAVSVDPKGNWSAAGWSGGSLHEMRSCTLDDLANGECHYWITAEVEVPAIKTIAGTVKEADND